MKKIAILSFLLLFGSLNVFSMQTLNPENQEQEIIIYNMVPENIYVRIKKQNGTLIPLSYPKNQTLATNHEITLIAPNDYFSASFKKEDAPLRLRMWPSTFTPQLATGDNKEAIEKENQRKSKLAVHINFLENQNKQIKLLVRNPHSGQWYFTVPPQHEEGLLFCNPDQ